MARINAMWPERIDQAGITKRVVIRVHVRLDDGTGQWHYFGITEAESPRPHDETDPIFEYIYIQFPQAFDDLTNEDAEDALFTLGVRAGLTREGVL